MDGRPQLRFILVITSLPRQHSQVAAIKGGHQDLRQNLKGKVNRNDGGVDAPRIPLS